MRHVNVSEKIRVEESIPCSTPIDKGTVAQKKIYLSQYKNIYPNTKIFIAIQKYLSQYKSN